MSEIMWNISLTKAHTWMYQPRRASEASHIADVDIPERFIFHRSVVWFQNVSATVQGGGKGEREGEI